MGTIGWGSKTVGGQLDHLYDTFRNAGGNFFDSAHCYQFWMPDGLGASERALGEIVRRRGDRDRVILATKGGHPNDRNGYPRPDRYLAPEVIAKDIEESLDRLGDDSIDLYYLHRDDRRVPVGEIVDCLNEHVSRGELRQLGASNWSTARIAAANEYAAAHDRIGFIANQPKFSLAMGDPTDFGMADVLWHASSRMTVCAYSPTANGYFATNGAKGAAAWDSPTSRARLREANQIAMEMHSTPNQIALAWLLHQSFPVIPILGTADVSHLLDALGAGAIHLFECHMRALSAWR
jgi:aryl-alcohol dehydrogenase-like predicted oxidoreductase